ncbi:oxidative damage protection protein [Buchnera aphidicola]|uniref:oxidative damage protection protein n=1 Tax=Buchnera aphidicola TaxID=9 RepID=UPI0031B849B1
MKLIFCKYFKKKLQGMEHQLYPGEIGEKIYKNISQKAWKIWISKQTKIINENNLDMTNEKHYKMIENYMKEFLFKK